MAISQELNISIPIKMLSQVFRELEKPIEQLSRRILGDFTAYGSMLYALASSHS
jgi:hypothetical protein